MRLSPLGACSGRTFTRISAAGPAVSEPQTTATTAEAAECSARALCAPGSPNLLPHSLGHRHPQPRPLTEGATGTEAEGSGPGRVADQRQPDGADPAPASGLFLSHSLLHV